jgi:hypothetical protein
MTSRAFRNPYFSSPRPSNTTENRRLNSMT